MIILTIDTSGLIYSAALLQDNEVICQVKATEKNMQCEELIFQIEMLLRNSSLTYADLDIIVVTSGPGTFNGVRIGISAAYGISLARGIKIATLSTLEVMAYRDRATSVCFTQDNCIGFMQDFDYQFNSISQVKEVRLDELDLKNLLLFDINTYDSSEVSNAVSAALLYLQRGGNEPNLFYGKAPSIHVKNPFS